MKVKHVRYGRLVSFGQFNNKSLTLEAEVEAGENWETTLGELKAEVAEKLNDTRPTHWQEEEAKAQEVLRAILDKKAEIEDWMTKNRKIIQLMKLKGDLD